MISYRYLIHSISSKGNILILNIMLTRLFQLNFKKMYKAIKDLQCNILPFPLFLAFLYFYPFNANMCKRSRN